MSKDLHVSESRFHGLRSAELFELYSRAVQRYYGLVGDLRESSMQFAYPSPEAKARDITPILDHDAVQLESIRYAIVQAQEYAAELYRRSKNEQP